MTKVIEKYHEYVDKRGSCISVFKSVTEYFNIKSAIYPGSYIHITPSLVIPEMYYVDTDKKALKFYKNIKTIEQYIEKNKLYDEASKLNFEGIDFTNHLNAKKSHYDLMISLYSGFISYHCKSYLKIDGLLLVNDSHGDATLAYFDPDYAFVGVVEQENGNIVIMTSDLEKYFKLYKNKEVDISKVRSEMKGPKYRIRTEYYLFKKIK